MSGDGWDVHLQSLGDQESGRQQKENDTKEMSNKELLEMIQVKDAEIVLLSKRAEKAERLLQKANLYNEELRMEISTLSSQVHEYRTLKKSGVSISSQVTLEDIDAAYGEKPMPTWDPGLHTGNSEMSISESLKAAAEEIMQVQESEYNTTISETSQNQSSSDYVYDAQTGFYYHPATGYYWDPTSQLFYDYTSGTYFQYNESTGEYTVHSQVDVHANTNAAYYNDGTSRELIDTLSSHLSEMSIGTQRYQKNALELAESHPPCIRIMVQKSEHLQLGSLHIITCAGGSIGREPNMGHAVEIHDLNISKYHAQVDYNYEKGCYCVTDKGSQNGTKLNSVWLSKSKQESFPHPLKHEDILEIGGTTLLLHIHSGHDTCQDCEPGQVQARLKAENPIKNDHVVLSKSERNRQRIKELKQIKKKYGLQNSYFENGGANVTNPDYCDKAYLRRKHIGSEPDMSSITPSKEMPASVQSPISTSNKGYKLLAKMGWKEGEGLGKDNSGIAEPINVGLRVDQSAGLGSAEGVSLSLDDAHKSAKAKRWAQARRIYNRLESQDPNSSKQSAENNSDSGRDVSERLSNPAQSLLSNNENTDIKPDPLVISPAVSITTTKKYTSASKISWVKGATQTHQPHGAVKQSLENTDDPT